jgi:hypothetical protein
VVREADHELRLDEIGVLVRDRREAFRRLLAGRVIPPGRLVGGGEELERALVVLARIGRTSRLGSTLPGVAFSDLTICGGGGGLPPPATGPPYRRRSQSSTSQPTTAPTLA